MRISRQRAKTFRRFLDEDLQNFQWPTHGRSWPQNGNWIFSIRGALGMSARTLAKRMGIKLASIQKMEKCERTHSITLDTLNRAAEAMDCRLVYAIVPKAGTYTETLDRRAMTIRPGEKLEDKIARMRLYDRQDPRIWANASNTSGGIVRGRAKNATARKFSLRTEF